MLGNNININVNQPGKLSGKTALHQAVMGVAEKYDNYKLVNAYHCCIADLLKKGAIELKDKQGKLPRDYAATSEQASKMITSLMRPREFWG